MDIKEYKQKLNLKLKEYKENQNKKLEKFKSKSKRKNKGGGSTTMSIIRSSRRVASLQPSAPPTAQTQRLTL